VDLELGDDVAGNHLGGETAGRTVLDPVHDLAVHHQRHPFGAAEVQAAGDGGLEPGPGTPGLVEHGGVGDLELGDGEGPVEAGPAVLHRQWGRA
jgi:hypothetical protein